MVLIEFIIGIVYTDSSSYGLSGVSSRPGENNIKVEHSSPSFLVKKIQGHLSYGN